MAETGAPHSVIATLMGTRLPMSCFDIRQGQVRFSSVKVSYHLPLGKKILPFLSLSYVLRKERIGLCRGRWKT